MKQKKITNSKKSKSTKPIKSDTNIQRKWYEDYIDINTMESRVISNEALEGLGKELVAWANAAVDAMENRKTDSPLHFKLTQFFRNKGIDGESVTRFKKRSPEFLRSYNHAIRMMGDVREIGALTKKLDGGIVSMMMPRYDPEWKEFIEWKARLKSENQATGIYTVTLPAIPSSPLVPDLPTKDPEDVAREARNKTCRSRHEKTVV